MIVRVHSNGRPGLAIALFSLGICLFAINDALGKWLVADYPVGQIMLIRTIGAGVFLLPMLVSRPESRRMPPRLGLHLLRVLVMAGDSFAFYAATQALPLADVMTFYLAAPLFITVLAVALLGERIGPWRIAALGLGFLGVLVALRPSGQVLSGHALIALGGSLMFAIAMVITRRLSRTDWLTLVAWQFVGAGLIGGAVSAFHWVTPSLRDAGLMLLVGLVSMTCFICVNKALSLAQASLLAPFHYTAIVWAVLLGWLIWGDLPSQAMWVGIALIVASGALILFRPQQDVAAVE
ncbi:DMT family transporter [Lichenihabitans sp. Uapishka_5]|uniref:DMT family transporter n=1 Tax=Lichenihabitans sp. Uapishka_5 TaxID=3037302 RepID=UPI0029E7D0E6|nr:DMT family transporter [Lichenihabitans sp. Uapishka_5]MDX7953076.1 DMT family transporter [Lichenihabitans sp. Uapishka_5]